MPVIKGNHMKFFTTCPRFADVRTFAVAAFALLGMMVFASGCSRSSLGGQVKGESFRYDSGSPARAAKKSRPAPSVSKDMAEGAAGMNDYDEAAPDAEPSGDGRNRNTSPDAADESVVIYEADCSITVKSVSDSIRAVELLAKDFGARLEQSQSQGRYNSATVTVRVPVARFDDFLKALPKIGSVTGKNITATNVSDEYRDLSSRLESAEKVRDRLDALLKKEISVAGRIAILKEIDRINAKIAAVKARLDYLGNLADLSTVRISLYAERTDSTYGYIGSPFRWISALAPKSRSIKKEASFEAVPPQGYFSLEKDFADKGDALYTSPGRKAMIRAGVTDNYPKMDLAFWIAALDDDAANRLYKAASSASVNGSGCAFAVRSFRTSGETWYAVAVAVRDDKVLVVEDVFDGEKNYTEHYPLFETFLKSVRWK